MLPDAHNHVVPNRLFTGVAFPDKLESYAHRTVAPGGPTLAQDLRGSWSLHYDPFKQVAAARWVGLGVAHLCGPSVRMTGKHACVLVMSVCS